MLIWPRWCGICVPGRALKLGNSLSATLTLTVQPGLRHGQHSRSPGGVGGVTQERQGRPADRHSRPRSTRSIVRRRRARLPSPGMIFATGRPVRTMAPESRAMSHRMNDTIPIPPSTYPHIPGMPPCRPDWW